MKRNIGIGILFALLVTFGVLGTAAGEVGLTPDSIKIGTVVDTTGPLTFYGTSIMSSIEAYFKFINSQGGIYGRKLELVQESDNYESAKSVAALKKLITRDKVFCFISNMGTACVQAQVPILTENKIPLIGPTASGKFLNDPPKRYVFPTLMNYEQSGVSMIQFIHQVLKRPNAKIAMIGSESLGPLVESGVQEELKKTGSALSSSATFQNNEIDFSSYVMKAQMEHPDVVILVGIYGQIGKLVLEMDKQGWKPTFIVNASSADPKLLELAGRAMEGAYVQMNFAMYTDESPGVIEYRKTVERYKPEAKLSNFGMWGGYASAELLREGLKGAGKNLTREKLVAAMETIKDFKTDILPPISYGPNNRRGGPGAFYTKVENGKFVRLTDWIMIK
jgi:branched-chain amino acid transport system substrate-binding protein